MNIPCSSKRTVQSYKCKFEAEVRCTVQTWPYVRSHLDLPCSKAIS